MGALDPAQGGPPIASAEVLNCAEWRNPAKQKQASEQIHTLFLHSRLDVRGPAISGSCLASTVSDGDLELQASLTLLLVRLFLSQRQK